MFFLFTKVTSSISLSFNMAGVFHYCYIHNSSLVNYDSNNFPRRRGRSPAPGFKKVYKSVLLGRRVNVRATLGTQRAIDRAGGFDRFIYYTPEEKLKSTLAISLKRRMNDLVTR